MGGRHMEVMLECRGTDKAQAATPGTEQWISASPGCGRTLAKGPERNVQSRLGSHEATKGHRNKLLKIERPDASLLAGTLKAESWVVRPSPLRLSIWAARLTHKIQINAGLKRLGSESHATSA